MEDIVLKLLLTVSTLAPSDTNISHVRRTVLWPVIPRIGETVGMSPDTEMIGTVKGVEHCLKEGYIEITLEVNLFGYPNEFDLIEALLEEGWVDGMKQITREEWQLPNS